jgi:hypothetical protein
MMDNMESPNQLTFDELATLGRGEPLHLSLNQTEVVVVLAEQFERLKKCAEDAVIDPKSLYSTIAPLMPEEWEDLSAYPTAEKL